MRDPCLTRPALAAILTALLGAVLLSSPALSNGTEQWVSIGPAPIAPDGSVGRVSDVVIDPSNASHWLIGASGGGVWESFDAGATWSPRTDDQPSLAMGAIAFAPGSPFTVYAATGDAMLLPFSNGGQGLLKSTDGGATWTHLPGAPFERGGASEVLVSPSDSDLILVGSTYALFGRAQESPQPQTVVGIHRSIDGGQSWTQVLDVECTDLAADPSDFSRQYAAVGVRSMADPTVKGIYRSLDAGQTWSRLPGPWDAFPANAIGHGEIAVSPANPDVAYVSITNVPAGGLSRGLLGMWKTQNAWDPAPVWSAVDLSATDDGSGLYGFCGYYAGFYLNSCHYYHDLLADPADPDVVYAGGYDVWRLDGSTWSDISGSIHLGQAALAFSGSRLVAANAGGVYSTADGGATWDNHNSSDLAIARFFNGSVHPGAGALALGGTEDNGTAVWDGDPQWFKVFGFGGPNGGFGGGNAISPDLPGDRWVVSSLGDSLYRTLDGGATFVPAYNGFFSGGILPSVAICPGNEDVLLTSFLGTMRRTDDLFSAAPPTLPTWSVNLTLSGAIQALGFAASDTTCSTYAAASFSNMQVTSDGGATWSDLDPLDQVPPRITTDYAFDPTDANVLYVSVGGWNSGHLFKTANALSGAPSWSDVSPPLDVPYNTVLVSPADPDRVFAGTEYGVYLSEDGGATWAKLGPETGMPNVPVYDLQASAATGAVTAFTFGRGAFILTQVGECEGEPGPDGDGDGLADSCDNCPADFNPGQEDGDGDGAGDACDVCPADPLNDEDGDGICASQDACPAEAPEQGLDADQDGCTDTLDGLTAIVEGLDLAPMAANGMLGKLREAEKALDKGNVATAINKLEDFIDQVEALRGGALSEAEADLLSAYAANLIALLSP